MTKLFNGWLTLLLHNDAASGYVKGNSTIIDQMVNFQQMLIFFELSGESLHLQENVCNSAEALGADASRDVRQA